MWRQEDVEKREALYTVGIQEYLVQPLWKSFQSFLNKLKIELPPDPAIPPLGGPPKQLKSGSHKRYLPFHVHSSTIHNSRDVQTT